MFAFGLTTFMLHLAKNISGQMTDAQLWGSGWAKGLPDYSLVWATLKLGKAWRVGPFQQLHWLAHVT